MTLNIDGRTIEPRPGQSLLDLIRELDMDTGKLSNRPLAAKIAGEVFNLNYIPVRQKDAQTDRISIRRAMAASGGKISLLGLGNRAFEVDMNFIIGKGLTLQGIYGRKMDNWHQMSYMVQGGLDMSPIITHRFHYTDFQQGFDAMNSGKSGKVILDWTERR